MVGREDKGVRVRRIVVFVERDAIPWILMYSVTVAPVVAGSKKKNMASNLNSLIHSIVLLSRLCHHEGARCGRRSEGRINLRPLGWTLYFHNHSRQILIRDSWIL